MRHLLVGVGFLAILAPSARAGTLYVNAALTTGANDGSSWANAFRGTTGLQAALSSAQSGDEIWVARGRYKPTSGLSRAASFELSTNVGIYGGFLGTEIALLQRDWVANVTLLTGDLRSDDGSGALGDNSYHVVTAAGTSATAVLDGFTVCGGNANQLAVPLNRGAGIYCDTGGDATIRNCIFRENRARSNGGGGFAGAASPTFLGCRFMFNEADAGGAFFAGASSAGTWSGCVFSGNTALRAGGISFSAGSGGVLVNCVFNDNTASGSAGGGAIVAQFGTPTISQCILAGNHAPLGWGAGIRSSPNVPIRNCIIYFNNGVGGMNLQDNIDQGTSAVSWSCVQGLSSGPGNIPVDPLFIDLGGGNLHVRLNSPCIDAGSNLLVPPGTLTDFGGNPRFADVPGVPDSGAGTAPIVDMGAYEFIPPNFVPFCFGDGTLATGCPCGNNSFPASGRGCLASDIFSIGAWMTASGVPVPDTVVLTANGLVPDVDCVFLQGNQQLANGALFGDGVRCVSGSLKRLYLKTAWGGAASAPGAGDPSISARSAALGDPIVPGSPRYYQVYFRDPHPFFCPNPPGNTWNISGGLLIAW